MSKKAGTAEKLFEPLYVDGQDDSDFEKRVWHNWVVAREGAVVEEKYRSARLVEIAFQVVTPS
jgi:hypothetical protein